GIELRRCYEDRRRVSADAGSLDREQAGVDAAAHAQPDSYPTGDASLPGGPAQSRLYWERRGDRWPIDRLNRLRESNWSVVHAGGRSRRPALRCPRKGDPIDGQWNYGSPF